MTFYTWLMQYRGQETARGDLADDVARDDDFPRRVRTLSVALGHLRYPHNACCEAADTMRAAWKAYERHNNA